jgi:hypothetical protein
MDDIILSSGKKAYYKSSKLSKVPEIDSFKETIIHTYNTPCPNCDDLNIAHSIDGIFFISYQLCCKECGIFFRPITDRNWASEKYKHLNQKQ